MKQIASENPLTKQEVDFIIKLADKNNDQMIQISEFLDIFTDLSNFDEA